jgi:hypothetical protein
MVSKWKLEKLKLYFDGGGNEMNALKIILNLTLKKQHGRKWTVFF